MQNTEDSCTRYLMREMDPSEEIEFERQMMKDENLLIEVETLRKTYARVGGLPVKTPPAELTDKVKKTAVNTQREKLMKYRRWRSYVPAAAAATLFLVAVSGLLSITTNEPATITSDLSTTKATITKITSPENGVSPWVDRNETLYFAGTSLNGNQDAGMRQEAQRSLNKLRLVDESPGISIVPRKIMLTSSNR